MSRLKGAHPRLLHLPRPRCVGVPPGRLMINESCRGSTRGRIASPEHRCCNWGCVPMCPWLWATPKEHTRKRTHASRRRATSPSARCSHSRSETMMRTGAPRGAQCDATDSLQTIYPTNRQSWNEFLAAEWVHQSCGPGQILNKASPATCSSTKALITRTLMLAEAAACPSR